MTGTSTHNGQIPTDPTIALIILATIATACQLTPEQAQAITALGGLAELALFLIRLLPGRR